MSLIGPDLPVPNVCFPIANASQSGHQPLPNKYEVRALDYVRSHRELIEHRNGRVATDDVASWQAEHDVVNTADLGRLQLALAHRST
jgi:hypothetical protein